MYGKAIMVIILQLKYINSKNSLLTFLLTYPTDMRWDFIKDVPNIKISICKSLSNLQAYDVYTDIYTNKCSFLI